MKRKLIFYVGGLELPEGNAATQRVINNCKLFSKLGHQIFLRGIKRFNKTTDNQTIDFDFEVSTYPRKLSEWIKYLSSISDIKKTINRVGKPDIIIAYNYPSIAMLKIMRYCKKNGIIIISDCTEWYGFQGKNFLLKVFKWLDSSISMRFINRKVDGLIVISSFLYDFYHSRRNGVVLIPPLVDKNDSKWHIDSPKSVTEDIQQTTILYFGSMGRNKDRISDFLRVLNYNPHLVLKIVGLEKENYLHYVPKDKKILEGLANKVEFLGRKSHNQTIAFLKKADFVVFFRDFRFVANRAGFPTKFVESYSCSCPVITNDNYNLKNYLVDGKNGFVVDNRNILALRDISNKLSKANSKTLSLNIKTDDFHYEKFLPMMKTFLEDVNNNDV